MHHQVTGRQRQRVDGVAPLGCQPLALHGGDPAAGQIRLGDHHQVRAGDDDAVVQRSLEHPDDAGPGRRAGFQHGGRGVAFGQPFHHPVCGPGAGRDDGGVAAGADVGAQHREDAVDVVLMAARRRRRPHVQLHRRLVGQLAQRPPRVPAPDRRRPHLVQLGEARSAQLLDVDRRLILQDPQRRDRPGGLQELAAGLDQVGGPGADLLRVAQQHRGALGQLIGEQHLLAGPQHRQQRLHAVDRDAVGDLGQHVADAAGDGRLARRVLGGQLRGAGRTSSVSSSSRQGTAITVSTAISGWNAGRRPRTSASR